MITPAELEYNYDKIRAVIIDYLDELGIAHEDSYYDGIKFCTGMDAWILIITSSHQSYENLSFVLLHRDLLDFGKSKKHKRFRDIPDYHIQKRVEYVQDILDIINYTLQHKGKWQNKKSHKYNKEVS